MNELRASPRKRVFKAAKIVIDANSVLDCTLRNVSETGACLVVENALAVPDEFKLLFDDRSTSCNVTWRHLDRVGVRFCGVAGNPPSTAPASDGPACPFCHVEMPLTHHLPRNGDMPEVKAFKCTKCSAVLVHEMQA